MKKFLCALLFVTSSHGIRGVETWTQKTARIHKKYQARTVRRELRKIDALKKEIEYLQWPFLVFEDVAYIKTNYVSSVYPPEICITSPKELHFKKLFTTKEKLNQSKKMLALTLAKKKPSEWKALIQQAKK